MNSTPRTELEAIINDEISAGNYVREAVNPNIVSALADFPMADSPGLRLVHDCSVLGGLGVNSYNEIEKLNFHNIDDAIDLIKVCYYFAKIELRCACSSVLDYPFNC